MSLVKFLKLLIQLLEQKITTKEENILIYSWIKDLRRHQLTYANGETLIHFCVNAETNYRPINTCVHLKFPNIAGLRLLLACGSR